MSPIQKRTHSTNMYCNCSVYSLRNDLVYEASNKFETIFLGEKPISAFSTSRRK